eukprot:TRINITY_DN5922_c0_g1_i9.p2 TRINITY_DN5922_c0_g1~~TRINITY_DN5922_c0_g1_i9.p2  ORF type:complete len:115 (+),score=30.92 TRINITY_DN5922_c0_g1_i9:73-417(+)
MAANWTKDLPLPMDGWDGAPDVAFDDPASTWFRDEWVWRREQLQTLEPPAVVPDAHKISKYIRKWSIKVPPITVGDLRELTDREFYVLVQQLDHNSSNTLGWLRIRPTAAEESE